MRLRRGLLVTVLVASVWTTNSAETNRPESKEIEGEWICRQGPKITKIRDGLFYDIAEHDKVTDLLRERRQRYEKAEARIRTLEREIEVYKQKLEMTGLEAERLALERDLFKVRAGNWFSRHFGFCLGLGAATPLLDDESQGEVDIAVYGGLCYSP
jgi:hypothetical protein